MDKQKQLLPWCSCGHGGLVHGVSDLALSCFPLLHKDREWRMEQNILCVVLGWAFILSLISLFTFCFALLKWDVTNGAKAKWAGEASGLCANPRPEKGQRVGGFLPLFHLLLSCPSPLLSYKMLQYFTIIMIKIGNFVCLCSSQCRPGFIGGWAWWGASEHRSPTLPWARRVFLSLHTSNLSHVL